MVSEMNNRTSCIPAHLHDARRGTWIIVADGSRARFFKLSSTDTIISAIDHELIAPRLKNSQIAADRPGRTFESGGKIRHAKEPPTLPARQASIELAGEVAILLEAELKAGSFEHLIIVAPPRSIGDLRGAMSEQLKSVVTTEIGKDLSKLSVSELSTRLHDVIFS